MQMLKNSLPLFFKPLFITYTIYYLFLFTFGLLFLLTVSLLFLLSVLKQ